MKASYRLALEAAIDLKVVSIPFDLGLGLHHYGIFAPHNLGILLGHGGLKVPNAVKVGPTNRWT